MPGLPLARQARSPDKCDRFDLNKHGFFGQRCLHRGSCRRIAGKDLGELLVHDLKVRHVLEIDIAFQHVVQSRPAFLQNSLHIGECLDGLAPDVADRVHLSGLIPGDLAGCVDEAAALCARRIRVGGARLEVEALWFQNSAGQDRGGWAERDCIGWFTDYAEIVLKRLADKVEYIVPFNERGVFNVFGAGFGVHASGLKSRQTTLASIHHTNLTHNQTAEMLRQN